MLPVMLYHREEIVHCTIYAYIDTVCIGIDKRSSHALAFMSQVKVFNTLGDYRLLRHHFTQYI